jgi:hypothetical protein
VSPLPFLPGLIHEIRSKGLFQTLLSDATYFVYRAVTFFNEIVKATHVRFRAIYRLKIIARARSITSEIGFHLKRTRKLFLLLVMSLNPSNSSLREVNRTYRIINLTRKCTCINTPFEGLGE